MEQLKAEEASQREAARQAARQRVLEDFESTQSRFTSNAIANIGSSSSNGKGSGAATAETTSTVKSDDTAKDRGLKRKFDLDEDHIANLVNESEERAMVQLEKEQVEARKAKLPSFWLPSLTPDTVASASTQLKKVQLKPTTLCHASDPPHPMTLKSLTPITFATTRSTLQDPTPTDTSNEDPLLCWVCRKVLSNASKCSAAKNCGHVLCSTCVETLCKPGKQCAACDTPLQKSEDDEKDHPKKKKAKTASSNKNDDGFIPLFRQGTGFGAFHSFYITFVS